MRAGEGEKDAREERSSDWETPDAGEEQEKRHREREIQVGGALTRLVPAKARHTSSLKTEDRVAPERRLGGLPL